MAAAPSLMWSALALTMLAVVASCATSAAPVVVGPASGARVRAAQAGPDTRAAAEQLAIETDLLLHAGSAPVEADMLPPGAHTRDQPRSRAVRTWIRSVDGRDVDVEVAAVTMSADGTDQCWEAVRYRVERAGGRWRVTGTSRPRLGPQHGDELTAGERRTFLRGAGWRQLAAAP